VNEFAFGSRQAEGMRFAGQDNIRMPSSGMLRRLVRQLLVTANVVPNPLIHVTLMMEAVSSSET
jgi:hypothetical protein